MNLLKHYTVASGYSPIFAPGEGRLKHLTLGVLRLAAESMFTFVPEPGCEAALTIITGSLDASALDGQRWEGLGGRSNVFTGSTDTLFIPSDSQLDLHTLTECEIVIAQAQSNFQGVPTLFAAADALIEQRGNPGWRREVRTYLHSTANVGRLILGEVASEVGEWSSFPPHKHDVDDLPTEADLEEIYLFKIDPDTGFAFQGVYDLADEETRNLAYVVRHHDVVAIPRGYHPVAVAPGHRVYYYWVLAGRGHDLKMHVEDAQRWLEPNFKIK